VSFCSLILEAVSSEKEEILMEFWLENFRGPSVYKVHDFRLILSRKRSVGLIRQKKEKNSQEKAVVSLGKHKLKSGCI
jgi:hypothetical protein